MAGGPHAVLAAYDSLQLDDAVASVAHTTRGSARSRSSVASSRGSNRRAVANIAGPPLWGKWCPTRPDGGRPRARARRPARWGLCPRTAGVTSRRGRADLVAGGAQPGEVVRDVARGVEDAPQLALVL